MGMDQVVSEKDEKTNLAQSYTHQMNTSSDEEFGKTWVLLVNLGTPDSPKTSDVRKYLFEFLNDKRVIDLPFLLRKFLVNCIIVPFRSPKSAKAYQELWTKNGSPLLHYGQRLKNDLQKIMPDDFRVELAMRYQNPSLKSILQNIIQQVPKRIIVLPLYPQYASATTGSTIEKIMDITSKWEVIPSIDYIAQHYDHPAFTECFVQRGKQYDLSTYDHILFSFHGLPERHVNKVYNQGLCSDRNCQEGVQGDNMYCYKATCYQTAQNIANGLGLTPDKYTTCFQSRLGREKWIEPYTEDVIKKLAAGGAKKVLVFSPAFVADCLETTVEIGVEYAELFQELGGESLDLVESLNDMPTWVEALKQIIFEKKYS